MKYIVTNKSVYCGFPVRWFIYTAITLVVQLFTISEYRIIVHCWCRFDALPKCSMVASPFSESMRPLITVHFHRHSEVTLYISRQAFLFLYSGNPLIHRNLPHTHYVTYFCLTDSSTPLHAAVFHFFTPILAAVLSPVDNCSCAPIQPLICQSFIYPDNSGISTCSRESDKLHLCLVAFYKFTLRRVGAR
jgi:hypothetical protein